MAATSSGFWFSGRLRPATATRFNVQEVALKRGTRIEILHDGIAVWSKPGPAAITDSREARDIMELVVVCYALISRVALDWSLEGWVEATDATFRGTVVGFGTDMRGHDPHLSKRSLRSVDMRRAARLAAALRRRPGWRLAVRDVYSALRQQGDDAFVFAYRALEDAARAVSGHTGQVTGREWKLLHAHLATTEPAFKARIALLRQARRAAAHGDEADVRLIAARTNRSDVVELGRGVVLDAIDREPSLPLERSQAR